MIGIGLGFIVMSVPLAGAIIFGSLIALIFVRKGQRCTVIKILIAGIGLLAIALLVFVVLVDSGYLVA